MFRVVKYNEEYVIELKLLPGNGGVELFHPIIRYMPLHSLHHTSAMLVRLHGGWLEGTCGYSVYFSLFGG